MLKKKEIFLLIFLILLQSCSGGRIGDFFESSFNDLEKTSKEEDLPNKLGTKKVVLQVNEKINNKNVEKTKNLEKPKSVQENKKDKILEKKQKQKNNRIKNSSKIKKIDFQSYRIIFILKDVDPKDPTEELNTILRNSEVNFEIEKIERILDLKNKNMNRN